MDDQEMPLASLSGWLSWVFIWVSAATKIDPLNPDHKNIGQSDERKYLGPSRSELFKRQAG